jgi:hypothetical protein
MHLLVSEMKRTDEKLTWYRFAETWAACIAAELEQQNLREARALYKRAHSRAFEGSGQAREALMPAACLCLLSCFWYFATPSTNTSVLHADSAWCFPEPSVRREAVRRWRCARPGCASSASTAARRSTWRPS